jgi:hypothetical protein
MGWRSGSVAALALAAVVSVGSMASAQAPVAATLSVLAEPVERATATGGVETGVTGMDLVEGDRIKTGATGVALITFLNGSTMTVLADSEVTVRQAGSGRGKSGIRLLIHTGRVWARVVKAAGSRSTVTLESNEYSATAHDGLIGAEHGPAGFVCWTRRGTLWLTDRSGQTEAVLMPGQRARARLGLTATPEPFVAGSSVLEVRTSGPVVPLIRMPDGRRSAGFLADDVEVNHVFGSLTEGGGNAGWSRFRAATKAPTPSSSAAPGPVPSPRGSRAATPGSRCIARSSRARSAKASGSSRGSPRA